MGIGMIQGVTSRYRQDNRHICCYPSGLQYVHKPDLLAIAASHPQSGLQRCLSGDPSPLKCLAWEAALCQHPDREFTEYVLQGIKASVLDSVKPISRWSPVTTTAPPPISIHRWWTGICRPSVRWVGCWAPSLHSQQMDFPKKSQSVKWRLIVDLSAPERHSVSDGIPVELFSLWYPSFNMAVHLMQRMV